MKRMGSYLTVILFSVVSFSGVSCANGSSSAVTEQGKNTLRSEADGKEADVLWTRELESMRLVQDISRQDGVDKAVKLTPQSVISAPSAESPVYPFIDGFGSLDTSRISPDLLAALDSACAAVSSQQSADSLMAQGCLYSYVLFLSDFKNGWKTAFGQDMPDPPVNLFTSRVYGAPFIQDDYEIPVRFKCAKGYADVLFCFIKNDGGYKISQIDIQKWGRTDGN